MEGWYGDIQSEIQRKLNDQNTENSLKLWLEDVRKYIKILKCLNPNKNHGINLFEKLTKTLNSQNPEESTSLKEAFERTLVNVFFVPLKIPVNKFSAIYEEALGVDQFTEIYEFAKENQELGNRFAYCICKKYEEEFNIALTDGIRKRKFEHIFDSFKLDIKLILKKLIENNRNYDLNIYKTLIFRVFSNPRHYFFYKKASECISKPPKSYDTTEEVKIMVKKDDGEEIFINLFGVESKISRQDTFVLIGDCSEADIQVRNEKKVLSLILFLRNGEFYVNSPSRRNDTYFGLSANQFIQIDLPELTFKLKTPDEVEVKIKVDSESKISFCYNKKTIEVSINRTESQSFKTLSLMDLQLEGLNIVEDIKFGYGYVDYSNTPFIVCIEGSLFFKYSDIPTKNPKKIKLFPDFIQQAKIHNDGYIQSLEPSKVIQTLTGSSVLKFTQLPPSNQN